MNWLLIIIVLENILLFFGIIVFFLRRKILRKIGEEKEIKRFNSMYTIDLKPQAKFKNFHNKHCDFNFKIFFESPYAGFYHFKLKKIDVHEHPKISSLLYIIKGEADGFIGNKKVHAKPGQFVFVPKGVPHHWKMKEPLEYIELSTPSLAATYMSDVTWK